jgi:hypothetical protein
MYICDMWNLESFARKLVNLDQKKILSTILNKKEIQLKAISLNIDSQLFERGVDIYGVSMRSPFARPGEVYADSTIQEKREKGQPYDRVTLRDSGAMVKTEKAIVKDNELILEMNTIKDGKDLQKKFGQFVGLDEFSKEILIEEIKPIAIEIVKNEIL